MVHLRIVPWFHEDELQELKTWFYNDALPIDMRFRAIQRVKSYQSKGSQYLPHVIASTAQITNSILLDQERSHIDKVSVKLSYTMSLIRFVNGILDPTQQSQFAIPLHTLAKRVGLPSWFVDLRHWGTHERELPSLEMLRIAAKDALIWLWDHYWNDDELEDEDEQDENGEDEQAEELRELFQNGKSLQHLLKEYSWYWGDGSTNLISSTNFRAEESLHVKRRREPTPQEHIDDFISNCKNEWNCKSIRPKFVEVFMREYSSILLKVMVSKLPEFDQVLFELLQKGYKDLLNKSPSLLLKEFSTWQTLECKLLVKFVSSISIIQFINNWSLWKHLVSKTPSLLNFSFCQLMSDRLAENRDNFKKKKRKRQFLFYEEVEKSLSEYLLKYDRFTNESKVYDEVVKAQTDAHVNCTTKALSVSPMPNDMDDIFRDLESLKRRQNATSSTISEVYWKSYPDWEPRPFGTL